MDFILVKVYFWCWRRGYLLKIEWLVYVKEMWGYD